MNLMRFLLCPLVLLSLVFSPLLAQQYELKVGNFNNTFVAQTPAGAVASPAGPPFVANPPSTAGQYSAMGQVSGSAGPISTSTTLADRFPSNPANTIVLVRASFGGVFASGVPRFFMGDEITPPLVQTDGVTPAADGYWRAQPVLPGESLNPLALPVSVLTSSLSSPTVTLASRPASLVVNSTLLGRTVSSFNGNNITLSGNATTEITAVTLVSYVPPTAQTLFPLGSVNVLTAATNLTTVTVASVPAELVVGSILLGQPVTKITGNNVTLAGNANATITSSTPSSITPATWFYFSPHADKVFANQPGRVTITWVTRLPNGNGVYETKSEDFAVSSNTTKSIRTIYWTESSFDGPKVQITDSRITTVSPAYYSAVPKAVAEEVSIPGNNPATPNLTTLSFDKYNGIGQLHAYNVEGRVFVEYLGNVRLAGNIYEFVGSDVVEIIRVPKVTYDTVHLGEEIVPHDGDGLLNASPVISGAQNATNYYGTTVRPDGTSAYYAERETSPANNPDNDEPASNDAYNKVVFYWMETGSFDIKWPKFQDRYWQRWSPLLDDYAHYTVENAGSTPETGMPFVGGALPQIVYQDDPAQAEARIDLASQRLLVTFAAGADTRNRSLLKFSSSGKVWYVNLYTQAEDRKSVFAVTTNGTSTVTLSGTNTTVGLEAGMIVTGTGITGTAYITKVLDSKKFILSQNVATGTTYTFTVESDAANPINATATVGTRIAPPAGHEIAGYISSGTGYYPAGYLNPFVVGVENANEGAIIPVNALPTNNLLKVRWFKKIPAQSAEFQDLYVPGKIGRYTVSFPASTTPQIVIAQGVGTDNLPPREAVGEVYTQNDPAKHGYNPNEEHALMLGGRAYALREDLNVTVTTGYTSQPFVLVAYTAADDRPAIHAYKVVRTDATYDFDFTATAGTLLVKPYPLPLLPLAMVGTGAARTSKDIEISGTDNPANTTLSASDAYKGFVFKDRKGFSWVHRGPHASGSPTLSMKLYYLSQKGFFVPGTGEPALGTILPFLRPAARSGQPLSLTSIDNGQADQPLTIIYRPTWPSDAPELRVGETLALPKFGLPQVRGQTSAHILYQQSLAVAAPASLLTKNSVVLHDPTREKTVALDAAAVGLEKLPAAIKTSSYQGKTYFQNLPAHLQKRIYLDPLRGDKGTLVFIGNFHDEIAGEDYFDLNLLTDADEKLLKDLVPTGGADKGKWETAVEALNTRVETFKPNPAQFGSYIVDSTKNVDRGENDLAVISDPNTAVDSYAVTATGQGTGFVTMVFGNGNAFTPEGDPVVIQVFKIANQLYVGDLKVLLSSNPLDEQVTLRHSGDFAGKPEDYEYEWRWATGAASAPQTYSFTMSKRLGDPTATPASDKWLVVRDPGAVKASSAQITAATTAGAVSFPRSENVRPVTYLLDAQNLPTSTVVNASSYTDAEIAAGFPSLWLRSSVGVNFTGGIPGTIVFSAETGDLDGFVLYVNNKVALAHNAPSPQFKLTNDSKGLTPTGLIKQFSVPASYFAAGPNTIEVAVYTSADPNSVSSLNFMFEAALETDLVSTGTTWQTPSDPDAKNTNFALVGGATTNPFGGPQFVLNDRWFTMRYRPKASANNVLGTPYSRWMPPQFVEGWVKRVLAAINPFEQRVKDLYNNQVSTDVSVLTQAGTRWEGDIALTLENVNKVGLIAIYETVLNRAKSMSIDANTNDPDSNNALLLAAGYLNDLYTLLGNEAYADAANPTISIDDQASVTEINTSRFSFESQVANSLEEELALLRGRDDFVSPGVATAPAYNRLYWNYTRGINSGEAIYAVNYNIKEKAGSDTADGVVDEFDAQRMFPQGHGDAYGHYLTALTGYYKLLTNLNFTWTPSAEAVTVLGQPVTVDFKDERKFAAAASNVARTAQQIISLVHRQSYQDNTGAGWSHFRDSKGANTSTGVTSRQGLDEWSRRATQGSYFHWALANSLIPDVDTYHTGVQKIDRTTVPELAELASSVSSFQTTADNASAHLNPLGLSPGAIAFDIEPYWITSLGQELASPDLVGKSHFEQIYTRALRTLNNAAGAFNQAAVMTRSLRNQQNQLDDQNTAIVEQELAYVNRLIDIFGRPYSGDIGPGKLYAQGYTGPDLENWFIVDRPNDLIDTAQKFTVNVTEATALKPFTGDATAILSGTLLTSYVDSLVKAPSTVKTVTVQPGQFVQYNDVWLPGGLGSRAETGELQKALQDAQQSYLALSSASIIYQTNLGHVNHLRTVFNEMVASHMKQRQELSDSQTKLLDLERLVRDREITASSFDDIADVAGTLGDAIGEYFPKVVGLANDVTSPARGTAKLVGAVAATVAKAIALSTRASARVQQTNMFEQEQKLEATLTALGFKQEQIQLAYEYSTLLRDTETDTAELMNLTLDHQRALENVRNVIAQGNRVLAEREIFRQRAAAVIQGYRTKDVTFRIFRNEALEQYRTLFDLASRYSYLAAKSYDYETGLLGSSEGQKVFSRIVASRSLGDLTGGVPQSTVSTLGDDGLAGTMSKLNSDFAAAEGRLGLNNPDFYNTTFSLRRELYRILNDDGITSDEDAWRQTLEQSIVANVLTDSDVATFCRNIKKADGSPVPGIIIPFSTTIEHGKNFFGMPLAAGDSAYSASSFSTKIAGNGIVFNGYVGMDSAEGPPAANSPNALSATPYVYLIPCGTDYMLAPFGDTAAVRSWTVRDQALPLPFNLGNSSFNSTQFFTANDTLSSQPWVIRKHQAFRAVSDRSLFYGDLPLVFNNPRLIGRSVWNGKWKIVIPAYTLLNNEQEGLNRFVASVTDIELFLRTYSNAGN